MRKFIIQVTSFYSDDEFSTCVLARDESEAREKGLNKMCNKLHFDGFRFDDFFNQIGDFYTKIDNGVSFYSGSRARYVDVSPYSARLSKYCCEYTRQIY